MATTIIWQNPSDANDKIEYNDDNTNEEFYRFRIDTGFEFTVKRDATNSRTLVSVSGSTWPGVLELNANGEIWAKGDLKIRIDSDGGGANKLLVQGSAGSNVVEIDETGNLAIGGNLSYLTARNKSLVVWPFSQMPFGDSANGTGEEMVIWQGPPPGIQEYLRARSQSNFMARCLVPVHLPNGAVVSSMDMYFRKTAQAGAKYRNATTYFYESSTFGSGTVGTLTPGPGVSDADGTTTGTLRSQTFGSAVTIDNLTKSYGIYVQINNSDLANGGPDGLGIAGFRLNYSLQTVEVY